MALQNAVSFAKSHTAGSSPALAGLPSDRRPVVISGPSGAGKSSLCQKLLDAHPGMFATTVSHTTRSPRAGEVEGKTYYYVSRGEFERLIAEGVFIKHAEFNGNLYGTSKQTVVDQAAKGPLVLLDIKMEGVKQLKSEQSKTDTPISPRFVFIKPPDLAVLARRLRGWGTEDESTIQRRLTRAAAEIDFAETGVHDQIIVNGDLERASRDLENFLIGAHSSGSVEETK